MSRLLLIFALGVPGAGWAMTPEETSGIDIAISVLPSTAGATVSVALVDGSRPRLDTGRQADGEALLDLIVLDDRESAAGWQVQIAQTRPVDRARLLWLLRCDGSADRVDGEPQAGMAMPIGCPFAIGLPLDRPASVFLAEPGTGTGDYRLEAALGQYPDRSAGQDTLILSIQNAP